MATSHSTAEAAKKDIPYRLPLVIGATGHRDLRDKDIPALKREVAKAIERLKSEYLHGDPEMPIVVLSSLAEGADRLIAQVAIDNGAQLIAPLPMEDGEYCYDFSPEKRIKPDAAEEFERLKGLAAAKPPMRFAEGNTRDNVREQWRRDLQYREVGLFIVRHCHVLIALWDGDASNTAIGGTAEVVRFKRDGIPLEVSKSAQATLDAPEIGPVIHIVTPRVKSPDPVPVVTTQAWGTDPGGDTPEKGKEQDVEGWENLKLQIVLTRRFNGEAAELERDPERAPSLKRNLDYLFVDPDKKIPGAPACDRAMKLVPHWCTLYQFADTLAQEWQQKFKRDWRGLFGFGLLAIIFFETLTHLVVDKPWAYWLLLGYGGAFAVVFVWFLIARRGKHQERFLDYRALAEALRVAVFWKLVGIGWPPPPNSPAVSATVDLSSGNSVANAYPIRQPRELNWVKTCLRTLELLDSNELPAKLRHDFEIDGHPWARAFWVHGQLEFFRRRGPAHDEEADKLLGWFFFLVILSVFLGVWLFLAALFGGTDVWDHDDMKLRLFIFLIGLLPAVAAVFAGYAERLALEAQARQYDRMRTLFERADEVLQSRPPVEFRHIQALYGELGAEAMKENAEWVSIYRQRPIRPP